MVKILTTRITNLNETTAKQGIEKERLNVHRIRN